MNKTFDEFKNTAFESLKSFAFNLTVQEVANLHETKPEYVIAQITEAFKDRNFNFSDDLIAGMALDNIARAQNFYALDENKKAELITNEAVKLEEDSATQNMRATVAAMQKLPKEDQQKGLKMVGALVNDIFDNDATQEAIKVINAVEQRSVKEYLIQKLTVAARTRVFHMANLLMGRNNYGPLEALEEIAQTPKIVNKLAEIAADDFMKDISLEESKAKPRQTGNLVVNLQEEIDDAFELEGYTFITEPYLSRAFNNARQAIENPHKGLGLVGSFNQGVYEYTNLTPEQKADIIDAIIDVVSDAVEQIKGKAKKAPRKSYTKSRSGFPGTATKTQKGHF